MRTAAVICELNPFHNGHAYLFRKLREETGADYCIALMSGNYVQRGEPAVFDKYARARMALLSGCADLVLELPPVFAAASAREFAAAGVHLAAAAGIVDVLGFGIETPASLELLLDNAGKLAQFRKTQSSSPISKAKQSPVIREESPPITAKKVFPVASEKLPTMSHETPLSAANKHARLRTLLSEGLSYPAAEGAVLGFSGMTPNNILATEYLLALKDLSAKDSPLGRAAQKITPYAIRRVGSGYHDESLPETAAAKDGQDMDALPKGGPAVYPSATALRKMFQDQATDFACPADPGPQLQSVFLKPGQDSESEIDTRPGHADILARLSAAVPVEVLPVYESLLHDHLMVGSNGLSMLLSARLLEAARGEPGTGNPLMRYQDASREIADRLLNRAYLPMTFEERIADTKTRQYTYTRISRALLHIALGMTDAALSAEKTAVYIRCLRVLGFRRDAAPLLHALKEKASVPVITKTADHRDLLQQELYPDSIYYALEAAACGHAVRSVFERSPVVI